MKPLPLSPCGCTACGETTHPTTHPLRAPLDPSRALLRLENAGVRYGGSSSGEWAVHGVNLEIGAGEIVSLIGPNGAGKTSLLRAIAGLQPLSEGSLTRLRPEAKAVGYVPQYQAFDRNLPVSVLEFLALKFDKAQKSQGWRRFLPFGKGENEARARALLAELGVAALAERPLGSLSGGEMQRVFIAYSLLGDPALLLLDEPMTGVDIRGGTLFRDLLLDLRDRRHLAIVMVSHDLHMVGGVSDVVVCLNRHVCAVGTPAEVLQEHVLAGAYGEKVPSAPVPSQP